MNEPTPAPVEASSVSPQRIVIEQSTPPKRRSWLVRLLIIGLVLSVMFNFGVLSSYEEYYANTIPPLERFHSGDADASAKIAVIKVSGTIMPPFTERYLKMIERAAEDDSVKGVLLVIDSPGGLVADSHQMYHRLRELDAKSKKPIFVSMKRMAASGGYYIAMGAGKKGRIFAEPTTWTGSLGVIIPRYDLSELATEYGVKSDSLKTGEFKDSLNMLRPLSDADRELWGTILDDAFGRFVGVISENREQLDDAAVRKLATGQIYTANQALENGLIDEIGFDDDALSALQKHLKLKKARVVSYQFQSGLIDLLTGSVEANNADATWQRIMESTVPRAMYFCSWAPGIGGLAVPSR
jgi:protease-4